MKQKTTHPSHPKIEHHVLPEEKMKRPAGRSFEVKRARPTTPRRIFSREIGSK
jgi:hypothetical protein